jgi:coenzyme F420-reducing hydrogenase beta subunit
MFGPQAPDCYAVMAKDEVRWVTSSGGMFVLAADWILEHNGFVCGAEFTEDFRGVRHAVVDHWTKLPRLMRSKYVQSDTNTVYRQIKTLLDTTDKPVLFCGCPCQVAALRNYIGEHDRLYTADLVCHGVPSPKAWQSYIDDIWDVKMGNGIVSNVNFRPKDKGWGNSISISISISKPDNSEVVFTEGRSGAWYTAFLKAFSTRVCCSSCIYAKIPRVGDITIGDFWGIERHKKELDDGKGTSCVLINSEKGRRFFESIRPRMILCERQELSIAISGNGQLSVPTWKNTDHKCFFTHLDEHGFNKSLRYAKKEIMDIGLVSWWYIVNYGSMITSYALYKYLSNQGFSVGMLRSPDREKYYAVEETNALPFARKHYRITNFRRRENLYELNRYFDAFILGSDQLWNYFCEYSHYYMLSFAERTKKKIAYSTSFGHAHTFFPEEIKEEVTVYMRELDYVSVRETDGVALAREFGVDAVVTCDPVFLLNRTDYLKLAESAERKTGGGFILAYIMEPTNEKMAALTRLSEKLKLRIVTIVDRQMDYMKKIEQMRDFGILEDAKIEEWLWHFANAKFVLTDSFHGTCFAIINEKPFVSIGNVKRGNARFESLLGNLGLIDRFVYDAAEIIEREDLIGGVGYDTVNKILNSERERGQNWLLKALNAPKEVMLSTLDIIQRENVKLRKRIYELEAKFDKLVTRFNEIQEKV